MLNRHPGFEICPGSGYPPYRYIKGREKAKANPETGRVMYAKAICELCGLEHAVNVNGVLRKHRRRRGGFAQNVSYEIQ